MARSRRSSILGAVILVLLCVAAPSRAVDLPLDGSRLRLADASDPAARRNLVEFIDDAVDLGGLDPTVTGATAYLGQVEQGAVTAIPLPADGWHRTGNAPRIDFKYKSGTGPVAAVRLVDGRSIRFTARGPEAYGLAGVPQGAVGVIVTVGGTRFCGLFGGTVTRDDGRAFLAREAPAPAACPVLGTTTTTTTSTTTTTTLAARGQPCAAGTECQSGFCADGVCCTSACDGPCQTCDAAGRVGFCDPLPAGQNFDECGNTGGCGFCSGGPSCTVVPFGGICRPVACSADYFLVESLVCQPLSQYPDNGVCVPPGGPSYESCYPYACTSTPTAQCLTSCTPTAGCAPGASCGADGKCHGPG
jgi:hypothetical protein